MPPKQLLMGGALPRRLDGGSPAGRRPPWAGPRRLALAQM